MIFEKNQDARRIKDIDVSDTNYKKAEKRYKSIANYIKDSNMGISNPDIFTGII